MITDICDEVREALAYGRLAVGLNVVLGVGVGCAMYQNQRRLDMHKDRMLKIDRTVGENGEILQMIAIGIPPTRNEYFRWRERKIEGEIEEFDRAAKEETRNAGATSRGRFHAL